MLVNFHMFLLIVLGVTLIGAGLIALNEPTAGAGCLLAAGTISWVAAFLGNRT